MSKLINKLINEHQHIKQILSEIMTDGINSGDSYTKLNTIKVLLITHLNNEDRNLYPILRNEAKFNSQLNLMLELFAKDMELITHDVIHFVDNFNNRLNPKLEKAERFGKISALLKNRMLKEEQFLYKEFNKINFKSVI